MNPAIILKLLLGKRNEELGAGKRTKSGWTFGKNFVRLQL